MIPLCSKQCCWFVGINRYLKLIECLRKSSTLRFYECLLTGPTVEKGLLLLTNGKRTQTGDFIWRKKALSDLVGGKIGANLFKIHTDLTPTCHRVKRKPSGMSQVEP